MLQTIRAHKDMFAYAIDGEICRHKKGLRVPTVQGRSVTRAPNELLFTNEWLAIFCLIIIYLNFGYVSVLVIFAINSAFRFTKMKIIHLGMGFVGPIGDFKLPKVTTYASFPYCNR